LIGDRIFIITVRGDRVFSLSARADRIPIFLKSAIPFSMDNYQFSLCPRSWGDIAAQVFLLSFSFSILQIILYRLSDFTGSFILF
jgi:hypothetical protein